MDAFTAVADPVRRSLLGQLGAGPARVVDLAAAHPISRPGVSKHLRLLTEAGLVSAERRGRERYYRLEPQALQPLRDLLDTLTRRPPVSDRTLDGLELEVRRTTRDRTHATPIEETA